jgi:hypothetical protein
MEPIKHYKAGIDPEAFKVIDELKTIQEIANLYDLTPSIIVAIKGYKRKDWARFSFYKDSLNTWQITEDAEEFILTDYLRLEVKHLN